jgi:phage/conjugal plasmid C-4 type zinc finger TraR family protein
MDIVDLAPDLGSQLLAARTAQMATPEEESLIYCEICGEPIGEARRVAVAGCRLCIRCAQEQEGL